MTNEEAITKLTNVLNDDIYSWSPEILTAFSMAVDALKGAEGDCISRAEAIEELARRDATDGYVKVFSGHEVCDILLNLPSTKAEQPIRCAHCKRYDLHNHRCKWWNHGVSNVDWCSYAERRTDEKNT